MLEEERNAHVAPPFEIAGMSLAERGKARCGDYYIAKTVEPFVVLVLADGVGSRPCDYLASQTACNEFAEAFAKERRPVSKRLGASIEAAHRMVQTQSGDCSGMLSTLVAVVWEIGSPIAHIASIGDSRIYCASASAVSQISVDDTSAEVYKRFGKPHIEAGAAVAFPVVTKAIGQIRPLTVEVEEIPFQPGESLVLASDGMYHTTAFSDRVLTAVRTSSLDVGVSTLYRQCNDEFADDATIAILRRNELFERAEYKRIIASLEDYRNHQLFGHIICKVLVDMVQEELETNDLDSALLCIEYAGRYDLQLTKAELIGLLDLVAIHPQRNLPAGRQAFDTLRHLIKRTM